jgi:cell division protein FtsN
MKGRRGRRRGGLFVLAGFVTILGVTFVAGVFTGRISLARSLVTTARVTDAETEPARRPAARNASAKTPEPAGPRLTFYHELTAPLTAPPPPPKPAKSTPPLVTVPPTAVPPYRPGEQVDALTAPAVPPPTFTRPVADVGAGEPGGRFTVQIAAYRTRPQAEALRDKLATSGLDVRVVEGEAASGVMYRVQIGEYATREAARAAAARLAAERSVAPFVTQR